MPGPQAAYGQNLMPQSEEAHSRLLAWTDQARMAAETHRLPYEEKWKKYYRLFRSWVPKREGDWRSRAFMPETFKNIETIMPRLVAQLPKFLANPVGPEDVETAETMEFLVEYAKEKSGLELELVTTFYSTLIYGTGILKTFYDEIPAIGYRQVPVFETETYPVSEPLIDPETQLPVRDPDNNVVMDEREETRQIPVGMEMQPYEFPAYQGPFGKAVDIFNFWPAPEASDVQTARFVRHRSYLEMSKIKNYVEQGIYFWPEWAPDQTGDPGETQPHMERLDSIDLGAGNNDPTRRQVAVDEFWTDDNRQITVVDQRVIVRVQENPFAHKEKPFIRFVDYLRGHEFWGEGEVAAIEGPQDVVNAISNMRIDEVRLKLHAPMAGNLDLVKDERDLQRKPGQFIRLLGDMRADEVLHQFDLGDVNSSAYQEVATMQDMIERATGVSALQGGLADPNNETATGMSLLSELGSTRFGMKNKLFEIDPYKRLGYHYQVILRQFSPPERVVRMLGPDGGFVFESLKPEDIAGSFDITVDTSSTQQSETIKRDQAMALFQVLTPLMMQIHETMVQGIPPPQGVLALVKKVLEAHGEKRTADYLSAFDPMQMMMQMQGMQPEQPGLPSSNGGAPEVPSETPAEQGM